MQIQAPQPFNCAFSSQILQGQTGAPGIFSYAWTAANGGVITSGADTPSPLIAAPGDYTLLVTDLNNGCTGSQSVSVTSDATAPITSALAPGGLTCTSPQLTLDGSGSTTGPGISYQWTAANGGNIVAGSDSPAPLVNTAGDYQLVVSDASNGCTATATVQVFADQQAPAPTVSPLGLFSVPI